MYLRETRQKRADGSLVTHLQLAESVWNPHKKRSEVRILHTCGRAEDPKTAERLRHLARSILKRSYWIPGSYVTSSSMSAGSNALPRLRTLCTNSKKPK